MNRTEKQNLVEDLAGQFKTRGTAFTFDFRGLTVEQATTLRRKVKETGSRYHVIKNTLATRAIQGTALEPIAPYLKGMTGVAYTEGDPVGLAKALNAFAKDTPALSFKGGVVMGAVILPGKLEQLASLPGRDELLGKLLYVLQAPIQNFLGVLQAPARDFLLVLKAAADKKASE